MSTEDQEKAERLLSTIGDQISGFSRDALERIIEGETEEDELCAIVDEIESLESELEELRRRHRVLSGSDTRGEDQATLKRLCTEFAATFH